MPTLSLEELKKSVLAFALDSGGTFTRTIIARMVDEQSAPLLRAACEALDTPKFQETGFISQPLSAGSRQTIVEILSKGPQTELAANAIDLLKREPAQGAALNFVIIAREPAKASARQDYLDFTTAFFFEAFHEGALRGSEPAARQALLDSFPILPSRLLSSEGSFLHLATESAQQWARATLHDGPQGDVGGIDKFPSLMSVRAERLLKDENRIVPSAMIRVGVHIGRRNIFMFHSAVNIASFIGDENLIDSHASVGSSAQLGNRNKIGSFVSLEGVLSPANAEPVVIGDDNFLGSFVRVGTGIRIGNKNFIGAGVNMSLGTKLRDCREDSKTLGEYVTPRDLNENFNELAISPNNATRDFNGVSIIPGEYILFENNEDFMNRFQGDSRIKAKT